MDFLHRHGRGNSGHGIDKAALDHLLERHCILRPRPERPGGGGYTLFRSDYADKEFGHDVHPHLVAGDERAFPHAADLDGNGVHVHDGDVMDNGDDERAAPHDHPFSARACADKALVLGEWR